MNDKIEENVVFAKTYNLNISAKTFCVRLLISNDEPPKILRPDDIDFLIHIRCDLTELDDLAYQLIERAAKAMKKESEKDPDGETSSYRMRVDTSKTHPNSNVYIRDESKANLPYMSTYNILTRMIDFIIDDLEELDRIAEEKEKNS